MKTVIIDGVERPVVEVDKTGKLIEPCPFCGIIHQHGLLGGTHRVPDCLGKNERSISRPADKKIFMATNGYELEFPPLPKLPS